MKMSKSKSELRAIAERLEPNATKQQLAAAFKNNPPALRELTNIEMQCEAEAADQILRQRLDDDPLLALTIIRTVGWI